MDVKSVAVIGAGAAGAVTAAALKAENYFDKIRVFERREAPGGVWIHDPDPGPIPTVDPGKLPDEIDPPLDIPTDLPQTTPPDDRQRWSVTPIYNTLTTNVPDIAMSFSDVPFAYGPFVPHYVARQYIENYFSLHQIDSFLELNTTVEDLSLQPALKDSSKRKWKLTLRKYDPTRHVDIWWAELFDAVILANGHYSVPYIPEVKGLEQYMREYPGRVVHSKYYRSPLVFQSQRVVVIGNSASGHDVCADLIGVAKNPVYVSRRSKSIWDGDKPPHGVVWKPIIEEFLADGAIVFDDDTVLRDVDVVVYCTGYKTSFPFWNKKANKYPLWDVKEERLVGSYWHTFFRNFPTLGIVGLPRTLTFRGFEYQAIAIARLWSNRNSARLPGREEQEAWEQNRLKRTKAEHKKFHDVPWDDGETTAYLDYLFQIAGLGTLEGDGRIPPVLDKKTVWAIEHVHKYPEPAVDAASTGDITEEDEWVLVDGRQKDTVSTPSEEGDTVSIYNGIRGKLIVASASQRGPIHLVLS